MEGFDYDKVKEVLEIPNDHQVEAMCAIGAIGKSINTAANKHFL